MLLAATKRWQRAWLQAFLGTFAIAKSSKTRGQNRDLRVYVLPVCYIAAADHSLLQASIVLLQAINRRLAASLVLASPTARRCINPLQ